METIKVNMSPNPLDVQTIHASQNDGEAREWKFELHNNGDVIDASEISDQLVFKAYKGGTEQLLPENGSTPTTSPFLGDIKYPQGLLTDQEFTYRQSPTEKDGLAKITDIKGNTLVWNQLVQNGNFENTNGWNPTRGTITANNNICQFTATETGNLPQANRINYPNITPLANHSYLVSAYIKAPRNTVGTIGFTQIDYWPSFNLQANVRTKVSTIYNFSNVSTNINLGIGAQANANDVIEISNVQMFDLTQMGLDITASDFTSLFPLSFYSYNQGSLLSFNGNGIKTVGKNRFNKDAITLNSRIAENEQIYSSSASDLTDYIDVGAFDSVNFSWDYSSLSSSDSRAYVKFDIGKNVVGFATYSPTSKSVSIDTSSCFYLRITLDKGMKDVQAENEQKTSYEPYTESTLSLPISTYFPTGMKSAGTVYDELTPSKAITRIGAVDLGTLSWNHLTSGSNGYWQATTGSIPDAKYISNYSGINIKGINPIDGSVIQSVGVFQMDGGTVSKIGIAQNGSVNYQNASATVAPTGILYYELATETETPITTASLVTENAEIPLSNEDGVLIGKCTEQLSENSGFIDAKIKLTDSDGTCYSNKLQLHVERSPQ